MDSEELGGNIQLVGFRETDAAEKIVLKKIVGKWSTRFSEICSNFQLLKLTLKTVHKKEKSELYEVHAMVQDNGQPHASEVTDRNLFLTVESALRKIESSIQK